MIEALEIVASSWPLAAMAMTAMVVIAVCWMARHGYNHQAYLQVRDERDRLLAEQGRKAKWIAD